MTKEEIIRLAREAGLEILNLDGEDEVGCGDGYHIQTDLIERFAALVAAQETMKQKPVAWTDGRGFVASHADSFPRGTTVSPLYAHPPTPRKPLTDEEISVLWEGHTVPVFGKTGINPVVFARAIERAHGIGEQHGS